MDKYRYWKPGGETGEVEAWCTFEAAQKAMGEPVLFCYGSSTDQGGSVYVGLESAMSVKLWLDKGNEV